MAERLVKLKFLGTPYLVTIDTRSFTLKKAKSFDDKFPTPLGYHRSVFTLCECLIKQGFQQVKGDLTVKTFVKKIMTMYTDDVKPFLDECVKEQQALQRDTLAQLRANEDYPKLLEAVLKGDDDKALTIAKKIKG